MAARSACAAPARTGTVTCVCFMAAARDDALCIGNSRAVWFGAGIPHDEFTRTRGRRYLQCCRSPLALAARFARKDGGARAHRSMQQHQGFSLDGNAETTRAHLSLYRWGVRRYGHLSMKY